MHIASIYSMTPPLHHHLCRLRALAVARAAAGSRAAVVVLVWEPDPHSRALFHELFKDTPGLRVVSQAVGDFMRRPELRQCWEVR